MDVEKQVWPTTSIHYRLSSSCDGKHLFDPLLTLHLNRAAHRARLDSSARLDGEPQVRGGTSCTGKPMCDGSIGNVEHHADLGTRNLCRESIEASLRFTLDRFHIYGRTNPRSQARETPGNVADCGSRGLSGCGARWPRFDRLRWLMWSRAPPTPLERRRG